MNKYLRPLSRTMLNKLVQCRQLELQGQPCFPDDMKYALAPLYKRGYIKLKKANVNGKEIMAVFTTPEGINCLEHITTQNSVTRD